MTDKTPSRAEALEAAERLYLADTRPDVDECEADYAVLRSFILSQPEGFEGIPEAGQASGAAAETRPQDSALNRIKNDPMAFLASALASRGISVEGAANAAVAAIVALDHYRAEREGNPLACVDTLYAATTQETGQ